MACICGKGGMPGGNGKGNTGDRLTGVRSRTGGVGAPLPAIGNRAG